MSRCQSGLCRIATIMFAGAPILLVASLILVTGCDQVQNPGADATTQVQSHAHDDHGHDDHGHDDHGHDDHGHDDHGHDDHGHGHELPATVEAAIKQLKKVTNQVRAALKDGETGKADSLVHSIGHLIEDLNEKIASADVEQKVKDAATAASEKIFAAYGELDSVLHGAKEEIENLQFSDFGPAITKATKTLESLLLEAKEAVTGETAEGKKPEVEEAAGQNPVDAEKPSEKSAE
ncbi:MAG: hypothetical protein ACR2NF_08525 [Pirellulales bacterium]